MSEDPNLDSIIRLRYVGGRFDGARLPLDVLADLPAFRDLLVAFARGEWFKVNTDRKRVPKGFDKSLSFDLTAIEDGSAVPRLRWDRNSAQALLPEFADELETIVEVSFGDVVDLIDGAANGNFPPALSSEHVRALNRFGSGLREEERIEFLDTRGRDGNVVYLDSARRKALITKVRETYLSRYEGSGVLVGSYADNGIGHVKVQTELYGLIEVRLDAERVVDEFDGNIGLPVQFDLMIELDNADRYRSIDEVHSVAMIDERIAAELGRCQARLGEIAALSNGWDGGESQAVSALALSAARSFVHKRPSLCGLHKLFPTRLGGVLFEFETDGWDLSVEFLPDGSVELFGIALEGDDELEPLHFNAVGPDLLAAVDRRAGQHG